MRIERAWMLIALGCASCGGAPEGEAESDPPQVAAVRAERRDFEDERILHGVVDTPPDRRATLAAEVPGRIEHLAVREGDAVASGALLAEIEAGPATDARAIAAAHLSEASVAETAARTARDHLAHLVERGIAPRAQLEEAEGRLATSIAATAAARAATREAARSVARTRVTASFAGTVVRVLRRPGETVDGTPATPIVEIADLRALEIVSSAPARDLLVLSRGQRARVAIDGLEAPCDAVVASVAPALDPTTGTGTVRFTLDETRALPLGLAADVHVSLGRHEGVSVPAGAVRTSPAGTPEVLVCAEGHAVATEVEVASRGDDRVEITRGLEAGALVVARAIGIEEDAPCAVEEP